MVARRVSYLDNYTKMTRISRNIAALSCSPAPYYPAGVRLGFWLTGKLGRAWVGAWVGGVVVMFKMHAK